MLHKESADKQSLRSLVTPGKLMSGAAIVGFPAYDFMSGNKTLGGTIGETAGGLYGYTLGEKLLSRLMPDTGYGDVSTQYAVDKALSKLNLHNPEKGHSALGKAITSKWGRAPLKLGAGMLGALILARLGQSVGSSLIPYRRSKPEDKNVPQNPNSLPYHAY